MAIRKRKLEPRNEFELECFRIIGANAEFHHFDVTEKNKVVIAVKKEDNTQANEIALIGIGYRRVENSSSKCYAKFEIPRKIINDNWKNSIYSKK